MRNKPRSISNSRTRAFCTGGGRRSAQGLGFSINIEDGRAFALGIRYFFLSGYRGLSCFAEHSKDRIPDHFQAPSPLLFTSQALHVLKRSAEFVGDVRKSIRDLKNAER